MTLQIDAELYLVWCDTLDIDEGEAHQVEAASHAEAVELVCQSLWDCDVWTAPPNTVCEVGVCRAIGPREEKWFFASLHPKFAVVEIHQEPA